MSEPVRVVKPCLFLTRHVREQYLARVLERERFSHLLVCKKGQMFCDACESQRSELARLALDRKTEVDSALFSALAVSREDRRFANDAGFLDYHTRTYGDQCFTFYSDGRLVFVLVSAPDGTRLAVTCFPAKGSILDGVVEGPATRLSRHRPLEAWESF